MTYRKSILKLSLFAFLIFARDVFAESAQYIATIDGDTIVVRVGGAKEHLRLIGIDCPESKENDKAIRNAIRRNVKLSSIIEQGQKAAKFTESLLSRGEAIEIQYDVEKRDQYGRLLGYVLLPDKTLLNEVIVQSGYAYPYTFPPNVKYKDRILAAFKSARKLHKGLWGK